MVKKSEQTRLRIIDAANQLFYRQGYHSTSFSDIVHASSVPRGNIYYYYKSEDEVLEAVLKQRATRIQHMLRGWNERYRTPMERLQRFLELLPDSAESLCRYGCPLGSLNAELGKLDTHLQEQVKDLFKLFEDWLTDQFAELGYAGSARELARHLLGRGQGIVMLAHVHADRHFLQQETRLLKRWLDALAQGNNPFDI